MHNREISEELRSARRSLESFQGYTLVEDLYWDNAENRWFICFCMEVEQDGDDYIGQKTVWRMSIDDDYPNGNINIYPDAEFGITHTFQHQDFNRPLKDKKYRSGKLCLVSELGSWGRKKYSSEPRTADTRLQWHVWRCQQWIYAALAGKLFEDGDPFELPAFPNQDRAALIFNENVDKLNNWNALTKKCGDFEYFGIDQLKTQAKEKFIITSFSNGTETITNHWGDIFMEMAINENKGLWILLDRMPILSPWQLPEYFGQLFGLCLAWGIDIKDLISKAYIKRRAKGSFLNVVCLGFPVPEIIGKAAVCMHWFAFAFPNPKARRHGFRPNSKELWKFQLEELIASSAKIDWLRTENWDRDQITSRGKIDQKLQHSKILLIGAGAVGSSLIELFARLGCSDITIVDQDELNVGNLSRHTLTLNEVGNSKAEMLSSKLNSIFPFMNVKFQPLNIQSAIRNQQDFLSGFDLVIDATAEDKVLELLENSLQTPGQFFVSVSTSYNANRLYGYLHRVSGEAFKLSEDFGNRIAPYITLDNDLPKDELAMIESIGCWHPIFPSRIDDVQMLVAAFFRKIEKSYVSFNDSKMVVVEKITNEENDFTGLNIIDGV